MNNEQLELIIACAERISDAVDAIKDAAQEEKELPANERYLHLNQELGELMGGALDMQEAIDG